MLPGAATCCVLPSFPPSLPAPVASGFVHGQRDSQQDALEDPQRGNGPLVLLRQPNEVQGYLGRGSHLRAERQNLLEMGHLESVKVLARI